MYRAVKGVRAAHVVARAKKRYSEEVLLNNGADEVGGRKGNGGTACNEIRQ